MQNLLVTVVAVSYNNSDYVIETLNSIKNQSYINIELIIVDDCSSDNSLELITGWIKDFDKPVKVIAHEVNKGVCITCNDGLNAASGKYIALIGTDDVMYENRIALQVEFFEKCESSVAGVYSDMTVIDKVGKVTNNSFFDMINLDFDKHTKLLALPQVELISSLIEVNVLPAPAMMYRTEALRAVGGYDASQVFEDLYMNLKLMQKGYSLLFINEKLVKYRILERSLSRKPNVRYLDSFLRIISSFKGLDKSLDGIIDKKVSDFAFVMYEMKSEHASKWLLKKFSFRPDLSTGLHFLASKLGVKYASIQKIKGLFK